MNDTFVGEVEKANHCTAVLYDAARRLGLQIGLRGVMPISKRARVVGRAYTVKFSPADQPKSGLNFYDIINEAPKACALVFGVGVDRWVFGGNLSRFAQLSGVAGMVLDGCVRDIASVRERDYPIFATGTSVSGYGTERVLSATGVDIVCGGIAVASGDLIVGDDDGVVCLPASRAKEILYEAEEIAILDRKLESDIEKGRPLVELHDTRVRWSVRRAAS